VDLGLPVTMDDLDDALRRTMPHALARMDRTGVDAVQSTRLKRKMDVL
jgi:hypothetical protein